VYSLATLLDPHYKGSLFAPDELEVIKQRAIDEARFEPSNPPTNTPQPPPRKKARTGPLDMLDAILGAPCSALLIRISCVTGGCGIVRVSAGCQVPVVGCRSQALSQRAADVRG